MTATNYYHDGHNNDGHKPRRPQTMTMTATTMTATTMTATNHAQRPQNMTMDFVAGVYILLVLDCLCNMTSLDDVEKMEFILKSFLFTKKISINTYVAQLK